MEEGVSNNKKALEQLQEIKKKLEQFEKIKELSEI